MSDSVGKVASISLNVTRTSNYFATLGAGLFAGASGIFIGTK